ncbi:MerR family transcriptional regulator [Salicibibacter cibarius]|uniref:MerR family transcriptional regulator n=1 Tax=Salicibibacter cibarius TaxID=2743000 RepID=A0A7T6Z4G7_9BACI|nr:MerR family transcriptional regulator [Salicibibacter cibarius]QQK76181.1 MerR family transcriptional regulator [Salicibibacter cibarius]
MMVSSEKTYSVGQFATLTGVTERTLRYYDCKDLLKPSKYSEQGHRLYKEKDLYRLQNILTLKYLDFSLEDIIDHLEKSGEDLQGSLRIQEKLLKQKQEQISNILETMKRVQDLIHGQEQIDGELVLSLIHGIQHEEDIKQHLADHVSQSLVDRMFMEGKPAEERLTAEQQMTSILTDINRIYNEGKHTDSQEAQEKALELLTLLATVFESTDEVELQKAEKAFEDKPMMFSQTIKPEVEAYMNDVFEKMDPAKRKDVWRK